MVAEGLATAAITQRATRPADTTGNSIFSTTFLVTSILAAGRDPHHSVVPVLRAQRPVVRYRVVRCGNEIDIATAALFDAGTRNRGNIRTERDRPDPTARVEPDLMPPRRVRSLLITPGQSYLHDADRKNTIAG